MLKEKQVIFANNGQSSPARSFIYGIDSRSQYLRNRTIKDNVYISDTNSRYQRVVSDNTVDNTTKHSQIVARRVAFLLIQLNLRHIHDDNITYLLHEVQDQAEGSLFLAGQPFVYVLVPSAGTNETFN